MTNLETYKSWLAHRYLVVLRTNQTIEVTNRFDAAKHGYTTVVPVDGGDSYYFDEVRPANEDEIVMHILANLGGVTNGQRNY